MRILGFIKKWDKLSQPEFTTFRLPRKDRDWQVGERVKVVFQPRRKGGGEFLGLAEIIMKTPKIFENTTSDEAIEDGFGGLVSMWVWLEKAHKGIKMTDRMNKLTLKWVERDA